MSKSMLFSLGLVLLLSSLSFAWENNCDEYDPMRYYKVDDVVSVASTQRSYICIRETAPGTPLIGADGSSDFWVETFSCGEDLTSTIYRDLPLQVWSVNQKQEYDVLSSSIEIRSNDSYPIKLSDMKLLYFLHVEDVPATDLVADMWYFNPGHEASANYADDATKFTITVSDLPYFEYRNGKKVNKLVEIEFKDFEIHPKGIVSLEFALWDKDNYTGTGGFNQSDDWSMFTFDGGHIVGDVDPVFNPNIVLIDSKRENVLFGNPLPIEKCFVTTPQDAVASFDEINVNTTGMAINKKIKIGDGQVSIDNEAHGVFGDAIYSGNFLSLAGKTNTGKDSTYVGSGYIELLANQNNWLRFKNKASKSQWMFNTPSSFDKFAFVFDPDRDTDGDAIWDLFVLHSNQSVTIGKSDAPSNGDRFHVDGNATVNGAFTAKGDILADGSTITADKFKVGDWVITDAPDFVFKEDYDLKPLSEVEKFIKKKSHLPGIPSAEEIKTEGFDLVKMNMLLLQKVEELTLHSIEQQKQIEKLNAKIEGMQ